MPRLVTNTIAQPRAIVFSFHTLQSQQTSSGTGLIIYII